MPDDWVKHVNRPQTQAEMDALRRCLARGAPYGDTAWEKKTAEELGLQSALRPRGRPKKAANK